jgi:hypothetical protein
VWLGWNLWWLLVAHRLPPSILTAAGVPCPTTGCTRALLALGDGDLTGSLRHNPFAVPLAVLFLLSVAWAGGAALRPGPWRLPRGLAIAWGVLLPMAWIAKLALGTT